MKLLYLVPVLVLTASILLISPQKVYAADDYRFEHSGCIFSYIFPGAPSVIPVWRDKEKTDKFLKGLSLTNRKIMQGVKAEYKSVSMESSDKILMQTYCLTLEVPSDDNILLAEDMLDILKTTIGTMDIKEVKYSLGQEEINFTKQRNGIRWMSLRGDVQQVINDRMLTITHYRDVFAYEDHALVVMISFIDSGDKHQDSVDTLLRSLVLAE